MGLPGRPRTACSIELFWSASSTLKSVNSIVGHTPAQTVAQDWQSCQLWQRGQDWHGYLVAPRARAARCRGGLIYWIVMR
jgi:hypothetical protein